LPNNIAIVRIVLTLRKVPGSSLGQEIGYLDSALYEFPQLSWQVARIGL